MDEQIGVLLNFPNRIIIIIYLLNINMQPTYISVALFKYTPIMRHVDRHPKLAFPRKLNINYYLLACTLPNYIIQTPQPRCRPNTACCIYLHKKKYKQLKGEFQLDRTAVSCYQILIIVQYINKEPSCTQVQCVYNYTRRVI